MTAKNIKRWSSTILLALTLLSVVHPVVNLIDFHLNQDEYLTVCQVQRQHKLSCKATCILNEMMPESTNEFEAEVLASFQFPPLLYSQKSQQNGVVLTYRATRSEDTLYYDSGVTSPFLRVLTPPPKLA